MQRLKGFEKKERDGEEQGGTDSSKVSLSGS